MIAALLLTTLLVGSDADIVQPPPTQEQAIELARQGKHADALRAFQQMAAASSQNIDARVWIGRMHTEMGRPDLAAPVFRSVMLERPQRVDAMIGLSDALVRQGLRDDAVAVLQKAMTLEPENPDVSAAMQRAKTRRWIPFHI